MKDPETEGILLIGEIGGSGEEEAAEWIRKHGVNLLQRLLQG